MAFCRNCGEEIPKGAKFCTNCGAPVDLPDAKPEPAENPQLTPEVRPERLYGDCGSGSPQEAAAARGRKEGRSGKAVPVLGILALVLALIGCLGFSVVPPVVSVAALVLAILSLVRKEWRKGLAIAALVIAALGLLAAAGKSGTGSAAVREESSAPETSAADSSAADEGEEEKEEEEEVQEFSLDGVTFRIPVKYEADGDSFATKEGDVVILIGDMDGVTEDQFDRIEDKLDERMDDKMTESFTSPVRKSALGSEVAGHKARSYCYTGERNDYPVTVYIDLINVEEKGKLLMVMGVAEESRTEEFEADYRKVIDSAAYTNAADTKRQDSAADSADDEAGEASAAPAGVNPDLKAFLDGYEAFIDKYIDFMQKYQANPTDLGLLMEYADMMQEYADFMEKVDDYDSDEMSAADAAYYLEVTSRCTQKMLRVLGSTE